MSLKPQDLVVCIKLALPGMGGHWTYPELARALDLSDSEANAAAHRASDAGLLTGARGRERKPSPVRAALLEFLAHGVAYAFYVRPGEVVRGMPTAHSAPPMTEWIQSAGRDALVWPDAKGTMRGQAVQPLYRTVPAAAMRDIELYEALALVDAVRLGRRREQEHAIRELSARLGETRVP